MIFVCAAPVTVAAVPLTLPTTLPVKPLEVIVPNEEPASANVIVPPSASNVMPPLESSVTVVPASSAVPSQCSADGRPRPGTSLASLFWHS